MIRRVLSGLLLTGLLAAAAEPPVVGRELLVKDRDSTVPLFPYAVHGFAGYINARGEVAIEPRFRYLTARDVGDFHDGVADETEMWIDTSGRPLPPLPKGWYRRGPASEGLIVTMADRRFGFTDAQGRVVIEPRFEFAHPFSEGVAAVQVGSLWGYVDRTGTLVIPPRFAKAEPFREGAARVYGDEACHWSGMEGCLLARRVLGKDPGHEVRGCLYSYIGHDGQPLFAGEFAGAKDFHEGLAAATSSGGWGYLDKQGHWVIPPQFDLAGNFSEGLAAVRGKRNWGYVDRYGSVAVPAQFYWTEAFSGGIALVADENGRFRYIDRQGAPAFEGVFDRAAGFRLGLAHACRGQECSYLDKGGTAVFSYFADDPPGWRQ